MPNYASTVIELAKAQVGYKETKSNITKYAAEIDSTWPEFYNTKKQGAEWCDIFFDWLMLKSFGFDTALKLTCQTKKSCGAGCKFSYGYYKKKKQVGKEARVGAQIFFSNAGTEDDINHTGIVIGFDSSKVYTIEGNKNNQVTECSYSHADKKIFGYGYPKYDEAELPKVEVKPDITKIATDVINGKYGNGAERKKKLTEAGYDYDEVQSKVNELLKLKAPTKAPVNKKTVNVSQGSVLNVRETPNGKIVGGLGRGSEVEYISEANGWTKIKYNGKEAYVFSAYLV